MTVYTRGTPSLFVTAPALVVLGACLIVALLNGSRELTVLCLLVMVLAAALKTWTTLSASRVTYSLDIDRRKLFPGESLDLTLSVENRKLLPLSFEVHVPLDGNLHPVSGEQALLGEGTLLWFQSTAMQWKLEARKRGVYAIGPATLHTGDILAFFMKAGNMREPLEAIVYPNLVPLRPLSTPGREFFGMPGGESPVEDPVYVLGTVDYQHGSPARHIHWKASARHLRLQQKVFEPTEQEKLLLMVDVGGFAEGETADAFEKTLEVVASLALQFDRRGCSIGFLTNGAVGGGVPTVPLRRGPSQPGAILEALARLRADEGQSFSALLGKGRAVPWGTTCLCLGWDRSREIERLAAYFARRRTPFIFIAHKDAMEMKKGQSDFVEEETHVSAARGAGGP